MYLETSDQREILNLSHPTLKDRSRQVIDTVLRSLKREKVALPISDSELSCLLEKSIRNAMEHGNCWNPKKIVTVRVFIESHAVVFEILDESAGQRIDKIEDLKEFFQSPDSGISILKMYCDPQWNDRGNILRIRIRRSDFSEGYIPEALQDL